MTVAVAEGRVAGARRSIAAGVLTTAAALVGLGAVAGGLRSVYVSGDTLALVATVDRALAHLHAGSFTHWTGYFALLQALPTAALRVAGVDVQNTIRTLVALNVASFGAMAWISWRGLSRRSTAGAILVLAVLFSSTLLWYLHASFGEPLAAAVTLAAVAACCDDRRHLAAAAWLFLAGLSKDTAVPYLLVLGLGASTIGPHWADRSFRRRRMGALALAGAASIAVSVLYNYARFGSPLDLPYFVPDTVVPWIQTQVSFGAAVWMAPNGGLLPFWPSFGVLLALSIVAVAQATRVCPDRLERMRRLAPAAAVAGVLALLTLELSKWWSPLGWIGWGPRLLLPWLPATAYVLVAAYAGELEQVLAVLVVPARRFWPAATAMAVVSLPQYVAMVRVDMWQPVFVPDAVCPAIPLVEKDAAYYYHCTNHQLWTKGSMLLAAYVPGAGPGDLLVGCACAIGLIWILYLARRALPAPAATAPSA
jgi:hypothetical protein